MAKRPAKPAETPPVQLPTQPVLPATYASRFQFTVDNGVTRIAFGEDGVWHVAVAMPTGMAITLHQKLAEIIGGLSEPKPEVTQ